MEWILIAAVLSLIGIGVGNAETSDENAKTRQNQKDLQEDAQFFTTDERQLQNEWDLKVHKEGLVQDPSLQMQGYLNAGVSRAAAAQAILGGNSVTTPVASNQSAGIAPTSNILGKSDLFTKLSEIGNSLFDNKLKESMSEKNMSDIKVNTQMIKESNARIDQIGHSMHIADENLEIAKQLNESTIGLQKSEVNLNLQKLNNLYAEFSKSLLEMNVLEGESKFLDAQTAHEYAKMSLTYSQDELTKEQINTEVQRQINLATSSELNIAQKGNIDTDTEGKVLSNMFAQLRVNVSNLLGFPVDSDETTKICVAYATGNWPAVSHLIKASSIQGKGNIFYELPRRGEYAFNGTGIMPYTKTTFRSLWNPINFDDSTKKVQKDHKKKRFIYLGPVHN